MVVRKYDLTNVVPASPELRVVGARPFSLDAPLAESEGGQTDPTVDRVAD